MDRARESTATFFEEQAERSQERVEEMREGVVEINRQLDEQEQFVEEQLLQMEGAFEVELEVRARDLSEEMARFRDKHKIEERFEKIRERYGPGAKLSEKGRERLEKAFRGTKRRPGPQRILRKKYLELCREDEQFEAEEKAKIEEIREDLAEGLGEWVDEVYDKELGKAIRRRNRQERKAEIAERFSLALRQFLGGPEEVPPLIPLEMAVPRREDEGGLQPERGGWVNYELLRPATAVGKFEVLARQSKDEGLREYERLRDSVSRRSGLLRASVASAVCLGLRDELEREGVESRVVYGHYGEGERRRRIYWTEFEMDGERGFISVNYGEMDPRYEGEILVGRVEDLERFGLAEYQSGDEGGGRVDEIVLSGIKRNNGFLPVTEELAKSGGEEAGDAYVGLCMWAYGIGATAVAYSREQKEREVRRRRPSGEVMLLAEDLPLLERGLMESASAEEAYIQYTNIREKRFALLRESVGGELDKWDISLGRLSAEEEFHTHEEEFYVTAAITEGLGRVFGKERVRTVFGTRITRTSGVGELDLPTFWTELRTEEGKGLFAFWYVDHLVAGRLENLEDYDRYSVDPEDPDLHSDYKRVFQIIRMNEGNLPIDPRLGEEFEAFVNAMKNIVRQSLGEQK